MSRWLAENGAWLDRAREHWAPRHAEPLRLRMWFTSPITYDGRDPITLEGALQFVAVLRETGRTPDDVFAGIERDGIADIAVPIADETIAGLPIARCSVGWWPVIAAEDIRFRRRRTDAESLGLAKVMINGGMFKSLNIPVPVLVTPWLDFYLRGDRERIDDLLRDAGGVGRDSTRGLGTVLGWEWAPDPDDRSLLYRGAPQRVLPRVDDASPYGVRRLARGTYDERVATTRAPYWIQNRARLCVVPVQRVGDADVADTMGMAA